MSGEPERQRYLDAYELAALNFWDRSAYLTALFAEVKERGLAVTAEMKADARAEERARCLATLEGLDGAATVQDALDALKATEAQ